MLQKDELKERIQAARVLRGYNQVALNRLFEREGLGKHTAGRIERGKLDMQAAHRRAFAIFLGVPEAWFTAERNELLAAMAAGIEAAGLTAPTSGEPNGLDLENPLGPGSDPPTEQDEDEDQSQPG